MKHILYIGEGVTLSHVVRPLELSEKQWNESKASGRNEKIHFACDRRYRDFVVEEGIQYHEIKSMSPTTFMTRLNTRQIVFDYNYLSHCLEEDERLVSEIQPDIIYSDFRFSMQICAQKHKIPYYSITNAYWSQYSLIVRPLFGGNKRSVMNGYSNRILEKNYVRYVSKSLRDYNFLRVEYGLNIVESIEEMYCAGDYTLFADLPEFAPVSKILINESYIGPITGKIKRFKTPVTKEVLELIHKLKNTEPTCLVYLSMGSSGDYTAIKNYISVLTNMNINVFVTAGILKTDIFLNHVYCFQYLYIDDIMPYMYFAITNGGSGANYQAFENNIKFIAIPDNIDQLLACGRVEQQKAGIVLSKYERNNYDCFLNAVERIHDL